MSEDKNIIPEFKIIRDWAKDIGIDKCEGLPFKQFTILSAEVGEVAECLQKGRPSEELADELGDIFISTVILAQQSGIDIEAAFRNKIQKVTKRKGEIINGIFRKEKGQQ